MPAGTGSSVSVDMGSLPDGWDGYALYAQGPDDEVGTLWYVGSDATVTIGGPPPDAPVAAVVTDSEVDGQLLEDNYVYFVVAYVGDPEDEVFSAPSPVSNEVAVTAGAMVDLTLPAVPTGYDGLLAYRVDSAGEVLLIGES